MSSNELLKQEGLLKSHPSRHITGLETKITKLLIENYRLTKKQKLHFFSYE